MLYACKVMRPEGEMHEWTDAAAFGWYHGEEAWNNDGPAIDSGTPAQAAIDAIRAAKKLGVSLGAGWQVSVKVAVRDGAETLIFDALVKQ